MPLPSHGFCKLMDWWRKIYILPTYPIPCPICSSMIGSNKTNPFLSIFHTSQAKENKHFQEGFCCHERAKVMQKMVFPKGLEVCGSLADWFLCCQFTVPTKGVYKLFHYSQNVPFEESCLSLWVVCAVLCKCNGFLLWKYIEHSGRFDKRKLICLAYMTCFLVVCCASSCAPALYNMYSQIVVIFIFTSPENIKPWTRANSSEDVVLASFQKNVEGAVGYDWFSTDFQSITGSIIMFESYCTLYQKELENS